MPITLTIPAFTLRRLAAIEQQMAALAARRVEILSVHLAAADLDPDALEVTALDLAAGHVTVVPKDS